MLTYRSCVQRHLRAAADLSHYSNSTIRSRSIINNSRTNLKRYTTSHTKPRELHELDDIKPLTNSDKIGSFSALPPQDPREAFLESRGVRRDLTQKGRDENDLLTDNEINRELAFFKDPLKLADEIRRRLKSRVHGKDDQQNVNRVKQIVRAASRDMECVVSWNHIINHELAVQRVNSALKTFNEVSLSQIFKRLC